MTLPATELCRLLAVVNALVDARRGAWALLRASRPAPAPTPRRRTGFSVAAATLITLRDGKEERRKGRSGSLRPEHKGNAGKRGPVCLSNAGRTCRFQRGGRRIAAHGGERRAARSISGGGRGSGVDSAGRPHYLNRAGAHSAIPSRRARHEVARHEGPGTWFLWGIV